MRVLLIEYVTAGGTMDGSDRLVPEALHMLDSLARDLSDLAGCEVDYLWANRAPRRPKQGNPVLTPSEPPLMSYIEKLLADYDAVWPVAPESEQILEFLSVAIERAGKILLNSRPRAVARCASKLATSQILRSHGVACVPTWSIKDCPNFLGGTLVIKPDDGVGGEGLTLERDCSPGSLARYPESWVVQPFLEGQPISVSALFGAAGAWLLSVNRQIVEHSEHTLNQRGAVVNAFPDAHQSMQAVLNGVARAIPELRGYVGIDLIIGREGPWVLEINPRLTTAYVGLREALGLNVAAEVLRLLCNPAAEFARPALRGSSVVVDWGLT